MPATVRRVARWLGWGLLALALLIGSGLLLGDRLAPRATGARSLALVPGARQTDIDRELAPLLAAHPGETGVVLVADGLEAFAMRAIATRKAGRSLDLQYYMWHDDLTGRLLAREVYGAAQRGVRVRLLLDDMNAEGLDGPLMALDAHPNIELRLYNPFRNRDGALRLLELVQRVFSLTHRMHNKAWIVDGRVAVVGGRNIGDEYFEAASGVNFRDLDMLLFGPAVQQASAIFDQYWNSAAVVPMAALNRQSPQELAALVAAADRDVERLGARPYLARTARASGVRRYYEQSLQPRWTRRVEVVADPPLKSEGAAGEDWLVTRLVRVLDTSQRRALLISPYFVPGADGSAVLANLSLRGVQVGVVTNSLAATDVPAVHAGYAAYRDALLQQGVQLHELKARAGAAASGFGSSGASLHTKAFLVDDARGFIGSFNLDQRSANLNTEMGVIFDDPVIAAGLREEYLRLAGPKASYWVYLGEDAELRWLERAAGPPRVFADEPDTSAWQRGKVWLLGWLPLESQL